MRDKAVSSVVGIVSSVKSANLCVTCASEYSLSGRKVLVDPLESLHVDLMQQAQCRVESHGVDV